MIKFPFIPSFDRNFEFSDLYEYLKNNDPRIEIINYPFHKIKFFYLNRTALNSTKLKINETRIDRLDMFKNISKEDKYFYFIAYHYFINVKNYDFHEKSEGRMTVKNEKGEYIKISFFEVLYQNLFLEKQKAKTLLRHEFILINQKFLYINQLITTLFYDYNRLLTVMFVETNVFAKYGLVVKEMYIEIFKDFHSNYIDYLSEENFKKLLNIIFPIKKEELSFQLKNQKNFKNGLTPLAREILIKSIRDNLVRFGFVDSITTFKQIDNLFGNRRREDDKIVWLKTPSHLKYLYSYLSEKQIIVPAKNKHWKIISDYFILKNNAEINSEKLKNIKKTTNISDILLIEKTFEKIFEINSVV